LKTRAFWLYASGLTAHAMITTGCTFHIAYIASLNGVGEQKAFSVFFPAAVMSTVADMVGGFLQECVDMRWLLATQGASMCLFIVGLVNFHTSWGYWLLAVGQGISGGMFAQLQGTSWPNLFGLAHLGAIGGYTMSLVVAGSALGPYSFTLSLGGRGGDELQNFNHNLYVLGILPLVVLLLSPFASKPTRGNHSTLGKYELVEMGDGEGDENDRV
jgi:OFA family oxalate/formate antiporter-like MFS transporter